MITARLCATAIGLACPVGLRAGPALAAIAAGVTRFQRCEHVVGRGDAPSASMLLEPGLPDDRTARAGFFARHAIVDALESSRWDGDAPIPCVLALPEAGPEDLDPAALAAVIGPLRLAHGRTAALSFHRVVCEGRVGMFAALAAAFSLIESGREPVVLIAGVDSLVDSRSLTTLVDTNRGLGPANLDGVCPGEAAGCVVLAHPRSLPRARALASITRPCTALEPAPFRRGGGGLSNAHGLAQVLRGLAAQGGERVDEIFAGITTEGFFGRELVHACLRAAGLVPEPLRVRVVGAALGDVGAAAGAAALVQAIASMGRPSPDRRTPANHRALAYASDDSGRVGGCIVHAP